MPKKDLSQAWRKQSEQPAVFTIEEFCTRYRISPSTFFMMKRAGRNPREIKLGGRVLITAKAAEEWEGRMEAETAKAAENLKAAKDAAREKANG